MKTISVFYFRNNQNTIIDLQPLIDSCLKDSGNFKNNSLDFIE